MGAPNEGKAEEGAGNLQVALKEDLKDVEIQLNGRKISRMSVAGD